MLIKSVKDFASMHGSVQGFGPGASPPMQLAQGHSAHKLWEIGELWHHIGRWEDRNENLVGYFFSFQGKFSLPYIHITLIGV